MSAITSDGVLFSLPHLFEKRWEVITSLREIAAMSDDKTPYPICITSEEMKMILLIDKWMSEEVSCAQRDHPLMSKIERAVAIMDPVDDSWRAHVVVDTSQLNHYSALGKYLRRQKTSYPYISTTQQKRIGNTYNFNLYLDHEALQSDQREQVLATEWLDLVRGVVHSAWLAWGRDSITTAEIPLKYIDWKFMSEHLGHGVGERLYGMGERSFTYDNVHDVDYMCQPLSRTRSSLIDSMAGVVHPRRYYMQEDKTIVRVTSKNNRPCLPTSLSRFRLPIIKHFLSTREPTDHPAHLGLGKIVGSEVELEFVCDDFGTQREQRAWDERSDLLLFSKVGMMMLLDALRETTDPAALEQILGTEILELICEALLNWTDRVVHEECTDDSIHVGNLEEDELYYLRLDASLPIPDEIYAMADDHELEDSEEWRVYLYDTHEEYRRAIDFVSSALLHLESRD